MFRNTTFQRSIASVLLATSGIGLVSPATAYAQAAPLTAATLVPLKADKTQVPLALPLNVIDLPLGKGQGKAVGNPAAAADGTSEYADALAWLAELAAAPASGSAAAVQLADLRSHYRTVAGLEQKVSAAFAATGVHLRSQALPTEIMQRHQAAVAEFATRSGELRKVMAQLDAAAANKSDPRAASQQLAAWLARFARADENRISNLPWGSKQHKPRKPALTSREHEAVFPRSLQLASAGSLSGISLPDAILGDTPQAADLAATDDAALTPEIRSLAASMDNNPVTLHNWVRNNIRYTAGFGSMQGAAGTLQARHGNAFDTASLLVALYRSAGIPARYVYGTIEVPLARARTWLGVDSAAAVQSLLTQAGIPHRAVSSAGQVNAIQLEHVWVSAFVDNSPSRGAVNRTPGSWVSLDPSFKLVQGKLGLDLRSAISLNEAGYYDASQAGASCSIDAGQGLNSANIQAGYDAYRDRLNAYLGQQGGDLSIDAVLGSDAVTAQNHQILLGTLPYKTVAVGAVINAVPPHLQWQFRFQLFANASAQGLDQATVTLDGSLARLAGERITLSFAPATDADAAALASYMPRAHADGSPVQASEFPAEIPGYLIRVKAELRAGGELVASGGSFVLGSELVAELGAFDPASGERSETTIYPHAGDYHALAIDVQGIGAAQLVAVSSRMAALKARLASGQTAGLSRDEVTGDLLYQTAMVYFGTVDANGALFQRTAGVLEQRMPSWGRAVAPAVPQMVFGVVNKVSFPGVTLDIDRLSNAVVAKEGGLAAPAYIRQSNQRNAAYAHVVLDKLHTSAARPGQAVSAVRALATAAAQTQPVYALTAANIAAILPGLALGQRDKSDIENAVGAGYKALLARDAVSVGAWNGRALMTEDSATGAGAYRVSDANGRATAALYLSQGMGWLAQAEPFQAAASVLPIAEAGIAADEVLGAMLGADGNGNTIRWSYFPAQAELANGLFLARLAGAQDGGACDTVTAIMAADFGTSAGFEAGSGSVAAAPVINSNPVTAASAGQAYRYAVNAMDPQGLALSYRLTEAPGLMTIGSSGLITWELPVTGSYPVTVRADNGKAYADQRYVLTVGKEAVPLEISVAVAPAIVNVGGTVSITVASSGGSGIASRSLTIDGQPVTLNASGVATITGSVMGVHPIIATATDSKGTVTKTTLYSVRNPQDTALPAALIAAPLDDADIKAPVDVVGSATDANFAYYKLLLRPAGDTQWREIKHGTSPVTNGVLGKLDPTQLNNGIYELVLVVADANGQQNSQLITVDINGELKIGQFAISFQDLDIDAAGIPIRVTRTYDTRRKADKLDFGYGWSVDYQSVQLRKNMVLGSQWDVVTNAGALTICLVPRGKHKINITLPNGKVERFVAANAQQCTLAQVPPLDIRFNPLPGTTSSLEIVNVPFVKIQGGQLYDLDNLETWNPKEFKLTTEDDYVYYLTDGIGITSVKDPSGNTLTYGQNGIVHSNGQSVAFIRDASGRIAAITDPAGKRITYAYGANGDLASVTDRVGAVARFNYNGSHGLTDYTDPRGIVTARYNYDSDGRLVSVTDAAGMTVETTHDVANNREVVRDRRGNVTTYTYDDNGNVVEIVNALGHKTTIGYDGLGNETSTTDALGNVTLKTFDVQSGKQLTLKDPLGHSSSWSYDAATRTQLEKLIDARGNATTFIYGENGQTINEPLGRQIALGYDAAGATNRVNLAGKTTTYVHDSKGNRTSSTDAAGNITTFTYDANNKEVSRSWTRAAPGGPSIAETVVTRRDAEGRAIEETDASGNISKTEYNLGGLVTATVDANGRRTVFEYDARSKLAKTIYPDGTFEAITYDAEGNQESVTDSQGRITRYEFDALNRLTKTIFPDGSTNRTEYDAVGQVAATIDAAGSRIENTYDAAGRLSAETDAEGRTTRFAYDANGNRTSVTDANGKVTSFEYDALNRLVRTTLPSGNSSTIAWNLNGTKRSETDEAGNTTVYGYNALLRLNQVTQTTTATAQVTVFGFDSVGNKISQIDAEGRLTRWEYDTGNRLAAYILPAGQKAVYTYDARGNRTSHTSFDGKVTTTSYDSLNQPIVVVRPDGTRVTSSYTGSGQLASTTVEGGSGAGIQQGTTKYSYDAQDRLTRQLNPDGSFLAYAYDKNSNIIERSTNAGTSLYAYDPSGRLSSVTDSAGKATRYTYDAVGRVATVATPNGITSTYSYDPNGRLQMLLHRQAGGGIASGARYTLAANGQRLALEEFDNDSTVNGNVPANPVRISNFSYDSAGRLTQEKVSERSGQVVRTSAFAYDKAGNRTAKTDTTSSGTETTSYGYDSNDRLDLETRTTTTGSTVQTTYTWDANGNLKSKATGAATLFYQWDSDKRLVEVKQGASEAGATSMARYAYDLNGNRIAKMEPARDGEPEKKTSYLVDGTFDYPQVVVEVVQQGAATESTSYLWGDSLIGRARAGQGQFYHADAVGTIKVLTDTAGNTAQSYSYDAFGVADSAGREDSNAYRYTGEYFDDTIGLQYNRARWLDPNVGRFVSQDPYEGDDDTPASLHRYGYAANDPVNKTDPSGEMSVADTSAASNMSGTLSTVAQPSLNFLVRKALFGNPKKGEFGIVGELIIDAMGEAVADMLADPTFAGKSNRRRGVAAHSKLRAHIGALNKWLQGIPMARDVLVLTELSLDQGGFPSHKKGSLRLDVIITYKGKNWLTFDLKTGTAGKGNIISSKKRIEYQRRFGARLITIGFPI